LGQDQDDSGRQFVKVDMSPSAVTSRLKRVSQLRRLCLALGKAKVVTAAPVREPKADAKP
jgi:hypothetical protein